MFSTSTITDSLGRQQPAHKPTISEYKVSCHSMTVAQLSDSTATAYSRPHGHQGPSYCDDPWQMAHARRRKSEPVQVDLFGNPIAKPPKPGRDLMPLDFRGHRVRYVVIKGVPWWVAADICRMIGVKNPTMTLARLDDDEKSTLSSIEGSHRPTNVVNEAGLCTILATARLRKDNPACETVRAFRRWIFHEVLPAIRRHGYYIAPGNSDPIQKVSVR